MKKNNSEYHNEYYGVQKKSKRKFFISFLMILLIGFGVYYFYGDIVLTGNVVGKVDANNSIGILTDISIPEMELSGNYKEVAISLSKGTTITLDDKKIRLDGDENKVIVENFEGKIGFDSKIINNFNGKISRITINNLPINSQGDKKLSISLSEGSQYSLLSIKEGVYFKNLLFITTGTVNAGNDVLTLNSENIRLEKYLGSLKIENQKLILQGLVESLTIQGKSRNIVLSK